MTRLLWATGIAAILAIAPLLGAPAQLGVAEGVIRGIVLDDLGTPLGRARVGLATPERRSLVASAVTDEEGRFEMSRLVAATYTLVVGTPTQSAVRLGRRPGTFDATLIPLAQGQERDLAIRVPRPGVVTGRVVDESGSPLPGASVSALQWSGAAGRTVLGGASDAGTNADGVYRLFGLRAGRYLIRVRFPFGGGVLEDPEGQREYVTNLYYPGSPLIEGAAEVELAPGAEVALNDVVRRTVRRAEVPIRLEGWERGQTNQRIHVAKQLARQKAWIPESRSSFQGDAGRHTVFGYPGETLLVIGPDGWGETKVVIGEANQPVVLPRMDAGSVVGHLEWTGSASPPARVEVLIQNVISDLNEFGSGRIHVSSPQTRFTIYGLRGGEYFLRVRPPAPWSVESAVVDGRDMLDTTTQIPSGRHVGPLVITLVDRRTALSGSVRDSQARPTYDALVVAFAADPARRAPFSRRVEAVLPDIDGHYEFDDLPPGDYFVAAADIDWDPALEPDRLITLESGARRVTLTRDAPVTIDLIVR